jgi:hypothetical protein
LPSARHLAKASLPSAIFCRVRRLAKQVFAECSKFGTRQRFLHSVNHVFSVVGPLAFIFVEKNLLEASSTFHGGRATIDRTVFHCDEPAWPMPDGS